MCTAKLAPQGPLWPLANIFSIFSPFRKLSQKDNIPCDSLDNIFEDSIESSIIITLHASQIKTKDQKCQVRIHHGAFIPYGAFNCYMKGLYVVEFIYNIKGFQKRDNTLKI